MTPPAVVMLPRLLEPAVGERLRIEVQGDTLGAAIQSLLVTEPRLRPHLFDEQGALRPHVHCFVDGTQSDLRDRHQPIPAGCEIRFIQAVSGG